MNKSDRQVITYQFENLQVRIETPQIIKELSIDEDKEQIRATSSGLGVASSLSEESNSITS